MSKNRLFDEFNPMSKAEWLDMVSSDPRSAKLLDKLDWEIAGLKMPAYATRGDLVALAPPQKNNQPTVSWAYPSSWKIAQAFDERNTPADFKQALEAGTEAIWLEANEASNTGVDIMPPQAFHFYGPAFAHQAGLETFDKLKGQPGSISILSKNDANASPQLIKTIWGANIGRVLSIDLPNERTKNGPVNDLSQALHLFSQFHTLFNKADLNLTALLSSVQFVFTISTSFYLEIARIRAFRLLLSKLICELNPHFNNTISIPFIAIVPCDADVEDTHTNILRSTTMAMAAAMGSCSLIVTHPFSEDNTDALAVRIARNIQLLLKHEVHLDHVIDPGAGSFYIETLTQKLANRAWTQFLTIRDIPA